MSAPRRSSTKATPRRRAEAAAPRARLRLDTGERRAQLIELGIAAFAERTYDEVSVEEVARRAGTSKGLLYHYFPTKRDFYVACLREAARQLLARTLTDDTEGAPLDRVRRGLDGYLDYVARRARAYTALFRGGIGSDPEVAAIIEETRSAYLARILSEIEGVPFVCDLRGSPALRLALRGWIGFVEAASLEWLERRELPRPALRDLLVEMLIATLRVAAEGTMGSMMTRGLIA
jgi:AcrR family transcriptional regulator